MSEAPSSSERIHSKPLSSPHRQRRQPPNAIPDKDLRFKIVVRVYGAHGDCTYGHSYIVDDVPLGISSPVAEYYLDATKHTFKELRHMLCYNTTNAGHMKKRSLVFQEVLFIMSRMPNIYNRPRWELNKFQFGFVHKKIFEDVKLIHPDREGEPIADLIGRTDFFEHDLILCPLSQIPPEIQNTLIYDDMPPNETESVANNEGDGDVDDASRPNTTQSQQISRPSTVPKRPDPEPLPNASEIIEMSKANKSSRANTPSRTKR